MNIIRNGKVAVIALLLLSANAEAQTTGQIRKNLITGINASCLQRSVANVPPAAQRRYCDCTATYLADVWSNQLVFEVERGETKPPMDTIRMAGEYCLRRSGL